MKLEHAFHIFKEVTLVLYKRLLIKQGHFLSVIERNVGGGPPMQHASFEA